MPVYNAERYLAEAVESILAQSFMDYEFLILDDGSSDGSPAILKDFVARDARIRLTTRPNKGLVPTLNELLGQARGEFIARMDSDDVSLPQRFERQVEFLRAHPDCVAIGSPALVIDPEGDPLCTWFQRRSHDELDSQNLDGAQGASLCHPSVMMRRQTVLDVGKYREELSFAEDLDLWLRLAERGRLANYPTVLMKYRTHEKNRSDIADPRADQDFLRILTDARLRRGLTVGRLPPGTHGSPTHSIQAIHEKWAWQALGGGHVGTARKYARRMLVGKPLSIGAWRLFYCALRGR